MGIKLEVISLPEGSVACPPCKGTGKAWCVGPEKCPLCHGEGILPDSRSQLPECRFCKGNGRLNGILPGLCSECGGWGRRQWKPVAVDSVAEDAKRRDLVLQAGVREFASSSDRTDVVQIEAGKPRTAHLEVAKLLQALSGEIRICDPYYGMGSLLRLDQLTSTASVKFLTQKPDNKEKAMLPKAIQDFIKQWPHFEFREHAVNDLHDRYIVTEDEFVILGHGLKDIGNKESLVVRLNCALIGDTIDTVRDSFDQKWKAARPLP